MNGVAQRGGGEITEALYEILTADDPEGLSDLMGRAGVSKSQIVLMSAKFEKFPTRCMNWMRKFLGPTWISDLPQEEWGNIRWKNLFAWWLSEQSAKTLPPIQMAVDFAVWAAIEATDPSGWAGEGQAAKIDYVNCILTALADCSENAPVFLSLANGSVSNPSGFAELGAISIMSPGCEWLGRSGVDKEALIRAVLIDSSSSIRVMSGWDEKRSFLQQWLSYSQDNQDLWDKLADEYDRGYKLAKSWAQKWLPGLVLSNSPLQDWVNGDGEVDKNPIDHPYFSGLAREKFGGTSNEKVRQMVHNHLLIPQPRGSRISPTVLYDRLLLLAKSLDDASQRLPFCHARPGYVGVLSVCATSSGRAFEFTRAAIDPKLSSDVQSLLADPYEQYQTSFLDTETLLFWAAKDPSWKTWLNNEGKNILYMWSDRTEPALTGEMLETVVAQEPQWLTQPDAFGKSGIDVIHMDETVRSSIKKKLLSKMADSGTQTKPPRM